MVDWDTVSRCEAPLFAGHVDLPMDRPMVFGFHGMHSTEARKSSCILPRYLPSQLRKEDVASLGSKTFRRYGRP